MLIPLLALYRTAMKNTVATCSFLNNPIADQWYPKTVTTAM
jgi:hypothetical protein